MSGNDQRRGGSAGVGRRAGAFTILELLVVVGIIVVLIGIAVTVGSRVAGGSKTRLTVDTIRVMDSMVNEYQSVKQESPAAFVNEPGNTQFSVPVADASYGASGPVIDSVGWLLIQMEEAPSARELVKSIATAQLQPGTPGRSNAMPSSGNQAFNTVLDAWGRPLRYVHTAFDGVYTSRDIEALVGRGAGTGRSFNPTTLTRDKTNSDRGVGQANSPYFYSVGPDGSAATGDDNVYTTAPTLPKAE